MNEDNKSLASDGLIIASAKEAGISDSDICAFYAAQWTRPIALVREEFAQWQFRSAPASQGHNHSIVALENAKIIAVMGVTPNDFVLRGDRRRGAELTTWVVAPQTRGKGVGKKILAALQDRYDVLTGAGITAAAIPLYLAAGFTFLKHMPRFFHIADFDNIKRFVTASDSALRITANRQAKAPEAEWRTQPVAATNLAQCAQTLASDGHFARDAARLAWRYDQHPAFQYEAFLVHDAHTPGRGAGVILRADMVLDTPILHVVDLFGDPQDIGAALNFLEAEARVRGAAFVDISLTLGATSALLRARGWSSAVDDPLVALPSLFYPVELRDPPTTSVMVWGRHDQNRLFDLSRLHITRGDMDLDRPTLSWYEGNGL
ncbi:GNAT family N-acetyltransferase [Yoonia algicola]|uniref:GNAT family N-acetyltransferase n=1 Tax=Yoonia algicola TaxID=3137368 RepID=A0AAN0M9M2_9RHOB